MATNVFCEWQLIYKMMLFFCCFLYFLLFNNLCLRYVATSVVIVWQLDELILYGTYFVMETYRFHVRNFLNSVATSALNVRQLDQLMFDIGFV